MAKNKAVIRPKRKTKAEVGDGNTLTIASDVNVTPEEFLEAYNPTSNVPMADAGFYNSAPEREKVYCKGCKYISGRGNFCNHPEYARVKTFDTAYSPVIQPMYRWIDDVNKNNDCPRREDAPPREPAPPLTFWQRLKGMFK